MSDKVMRLKREKMDIPMIKSIRFGDPMYFECYEGKELQRLVYDKRFRGKDSWVSKGVVDKTLVIVEKENFEFEDDAFRGFFAMNNDILNIISGSDLPAGSIKYPSDCSIIQKEIGLDTARFEIDINGNQLDINTMSDGYTGLIVEIYRCNKLVGIILEVVFGEHSFEETVDYVKYLFGLK